MAGSGEALMARYPGTEDEPRVAPERLRAAVGVVFGACGMSAEDADLLAGSLVAADRRGIHSHGVLRVPDYVAKLTGGGVDPRGQPGVASRAGAAIVVDGGNAMGQIAMGFLIILLTHLR
jgi:LDH2 family malate/lactate/ureidoglycolate dehydrogenase